MDSVSIDLANISSSDITMAILGYTVVFTALVLLFFIFNNLPKVLEFILQKKTFLKMKVKKDGKTKSVAVSGEVNAAIAAALFHFFNEMHDEEITNLTIKKVGRNYSPWSSKIYGVMNRPR